MSSSPNHHRYPSDWQTSHPYPSSDGSRIIHPPKSSAATTCGADPRTVQRSSSERPRVMDNYGGDIRTRHGVPYDTSPVYGSSSGQLRPTTESQWSLSQHEPYYPGQLDRYRSSVMLAGTNLLHNSAADGLQSPQPTRGPHGSEPYSMYPSPAPTEASGAYSTYSGSSSSNSPSPHHSPLMHRWHPIRPTDPTDLTWPNQQIEDRVATPAVAQAAERRRTRPARFSCKTCGQTFTAKHNLEHHMNSHNGIRPHECTGCGKSFGTAQVLKRHKVKCRAQEN